MRQARVVGCAAALIAAVLVAAPASADRELPPDPATGRALRDVVATIERTEITRDANGTEWLEVVVEDGPESPVRLRVAPTEILRSEEFALRPGDVVRVRYFVAEDPPGVQRIRLLGQGRTLRLRCFRGDPVWGMHRRRGPAPRGGRGGD